MFGVGTNCLMLPILAILLYILCHTLLAFGVMASVLAILIGVKCPSQGPVAKILHILPYAYHLCFSVVSFQVTNFGI